MPPRSRRQPTQEDALFGIEQGAVVDSRVVVPWQELETRRLQRTAAIPSVGELAARRLVQIGDKSPRNRFLEKFKGTWIPFHQQEVTFALRTLPVEVRIASKSKGSAARAVERVITEVTRYRHESHVAIETLEEALITPEDKAPIPEYVRANPFVRAELAKFLVAKNSLDLFDWFPAKRSPTKPNRRHDALLQKIDDQLENPKILTDQQLVALWREVYASQKARQTYWTNQYNSVKQFDIVRAALRHR